MRAVCVAASAADNDRSKTRDRFASPQTNCRTARTYEWLGRRSCRRAAAVAYFVAVMVKLAKQTRIKNKR